MKKKRKRKKRNKRKTQSFPPVPKHQLPKLPTTWVSEIYNRSSVGLGKCSIKWDSSKHTLASRQELKVHAHC